MRSARSIVASFMSLVAGSAGAEVEERVLAHVNATRDPVSWTDGVYMSQSA